MTAETLDCSNGVNNLSRVTSSVRSVSWLSCSSVRSLCQWCGDVTWAVDTRHGQGHSDDQMTLWWSGACSSSFILQWMSIMSSECPVVWPPEWCCSGPETWYLMRPLWQRVSRFVRWSMRDMSDMRHSWRQGPGQPHSAPPTLCFPGHSVGCLCRRGNILENWGRNI